MKRILSLFLSMVLVLSMVLGTFTVNVFAEVTGGAFKTAAGEMVKEFSEDFDGWDASYWEKKVAASSYLKDQIDENSDQVFTVSSQVSKTRADGLKAEHAKKMMPVEVVTDSDNKYLKLKDIQSDGYYKGRFYFNLGKTEMQKAAADEKMFMSVKLKADDTNFRKLFGTSDHLNTEMLGDMKRIVEFDPLGKILLFDRDIDYAYSIGEWYSFDFLWDNGEVDCYINDTYITTVEKNITSYFDPAKKYYMIGFAIVHLNNSDVKVYEPDSADASFCVDDLNFMYFNENNTVSSDISITEIGSDGVVPFDATELEFTVNAPLNGLQPEHIKFSPENSVEDMVVTSDGMGNYTITAQLADVLLPWTTYTLTVDTAKYIVDENGFPVPFIGYVSGEFDVTPAPFSLKAPVFSVAGSTLTAETIFANNTLDPKWAKFVLVTKDANGVLTNIETFSLKDVTTGALGEAVTLTSEGFNEGSAELFVIDGYTNKPLFDYCYGYNYDETPYEDEIPVATSDAAANEIVFGKYDYNTNFDHENNKLVVKLNTGSDSVVEGVLYVYEGSLSDGTPVYADYVTTASNGTLLKEVKFDSSIVSATKEYNVAFYSNDIVDAIEEGFKVYSSTDYKNMKRNNIFANAVKTSTFSGLKQVITGTDDLGNVINDAWGVFSSDINTSDYDDVKDKEAVFVGLSAMLKSLSNYDALCRAFETISLEQKNKENTPPASKPESNNKKPGSSSVSISVTPSKPSSSTPTVGGSSVAFTDMSGHWAQKHAQALVTRGIVNGYADGSFRGDSPITRAELTKIIVEALDVPEKEGKNFADVASSSWYNSYVSRAATAGVINGFEDGSFKPEANVSRQDAIVMIWRAMNITSELPEGFKYFADEKDIQDYSSEAIRCLGDLGIITGDNDHNFKPLNNITRAEMAAVICRAIDYIESHLQ